MGDSEPRAWYVLRTRPRAEELAARGLRERQVGVFLPRLGRGDSPGLRVGSGREQTEPLFRGYLFVHLDLARDYLTAAWTPGVREFLKLGTAAPQPIDENVLACLRDRADEHDVLRPLRRLRVGDQVEVTRGPFSGILAVIDRPCTSSGRIHVLMDLLRRRTRLELPASAVVPA